MNDSIADDLLRSGYNRWLRLEEEKQAISQDLKELFIELKGNGFTPKALRESFRRVRNINEADQQEHDALVDLYVASLTGARPAHTRDGLAGPANTPDAGEANTKPAPHPHAPHSEAVAGRATQVPVSRRNAASVTISRSQS